MKQITTFTIISLSLPDSVTLLLLLLLRLLLLLILCRAASSAALSHTGDLEWEVESTTVTQFSADWWDILHPLA